MRELAIALVVIGLCAASFAADAGFVDDPADVKGWGTAAGFGLLYAAFAFWPRDDDSESIAERAGRAAAQHLIDRAEHRRAKTLDAVLSTTPEPQASRPDPWPTRATELRGPDARDHRSRDRHR